MAKILFYAVMIDETGCEFSAEVWAATRSKAFDLLEDDYPESQVDQLMDLAQKRGRLSRLCAKHY